MGALMEIGRSGDLSEGRMKGVTVEGRNILLARVGERYYAADNRCPHMAAMLSAGRLEASIVTCPRHGSQFDLRDGRVLRWTSFPGPLAAVARVVKRPHQLSTYRVTVQGESILAEM